MSRPPVLDRESVELATDLPALVRALRSTYSSGVARTALTPPRMTASASDPHRLFGAMPSICDALGLFVTKIVAAVPSFAGRPTIGGLVVALSTRTGEPIACLDGAAITNLKCAAVTALVTDVCARQDVSKVGIVGSGELAFCQVQGVSSVREVARWAVSSRHRGSAERFAARVRTFLGPRADVRVVDRVEEALTGDVVCTATSATTPLVDSLIVPDGTHVNCMGGHAQGSRELPNETLVRSRLIVEDRELAVAEAGELHREALDLAEMLAADPQELRARPTVFSSTGHALLDLLATRHILQARGLA
jgi:ornithine cyclodeaminase/alanine dehydrogenase-like protein (mu-crystallin family)